MSRHGNAGSAAHNKAVALETCIGGISSIVGWVYRSSDMVDTVVNQRYAAVYQPYLVTFRRETDPKPTKLWDLKGCTLGEVKEVECEVKAKGTNTLVAIMSGRYSKKHLHGFKLHFADANPLTLYLETPEEAARWHAVLAHSVDAANAQQQSGLASDADVSPELARGVDPKLLPESSLGRPAVPPLLAAPPRMTPSTSVPRRKVKGRWSEVAHVNGVAVYLEAEGSDYTGGAAMASLVVHAPPSEVLKAVLDEENDNLNHSRVLEVVSDHKCVMRWRINAGGLMGVFSAPREVVLSRTWRHDEEGTCVVLYQSVEHAAAPPPQPSLFSWYSPVRMRIPAAGLTIAGLQPRYTGGLPESPESLLTMVIKPEPGGWLESGLVPMLFGHSNTRLAFAHPIIALLISLRDRVEHGRFVIQPLEWGEAAEEGEGEGEEAERRTAMDVLDHNFRTKSLLQARMVQDELSALTPEDQAAALAECPERMLKLYAGGTADQQFWSCPGAASFKLRGPNYFQDKKKVQAGQPLFMLSAVDLVRTQEKPWHVAPHLPSLKMSDAPFTLIVNMLVPGPPWLSLQFSWAADFDPGSARHDGEAGTPRSSSACDLSEDDDAAATSPVERALARFVAGDDATRNSYFKLIPHVVQGSWIIKTAVGSTPVILGRKLTTKYFKGELDGDRRYLEIDVDIGSSSAAASVVGLVQPATKSLVIDLAVLLEGTCQDELPEGLLGTVRLERIDLSTYKYLDTTSGAVYSQDTAPMEIKAWK